MKNKSEKSLGPVGTSYETLLTQGLIDRVYLVRNHLDKLLALGDTDNLDTESYRDIIIIRGIDVDIPFFNHPLIYNDKVVIDYRPYLTRDGKLKIGYGSKLLLTRARAELEWVRSRDPFVGHAHLTTDIYSTWVSNSIGMRLNLSMDVVVRVKVLAAVYWLGLLHGITEMDTEEVNIKLLTLLPRIAGVPATFVNEIITHDSDLLKELYLNTDGLQPITKLPPAIESVTNDEYDINTKVLYSMVTPGSYVGDNAVEVSGIALESPPTFYALVNLTGDKGIQSKTSIGKAVGYVKRKHNYEAFTKFMESMGSGG